MRRLLIRYEILHKIVFPARAQREVRIAEHKPHRLLFDGPEALTVRASEPCPKLLYVHSDLLSKDPEASRVERFDKRYDAFQRWKLTQRLDQLHHRGREGQHLVHQSLQIRLSLLRTSGLCQLH